MKKLIPYILIGLLSAASILVSCSYAQTIITTTTTTKNGVTTTSSSSSNKSHSAYGSSYSSNSVLNDTTPYKSKIIEKEFQIQPHVPFILESSYRNIEIKTWDKNAVKIEANFKYKTKADSLLSFDQVFEKYNMPIKSSNTAFEILAAQPVGKNIAVAYSYNGPEMSLGGSSYGSGSGYSSNYGSTYGTTDSIFLNDENSSATFFGNPTVNIVSDSITFTNADSLSLSDDSENLPHNNLIVVAKGNKEIDLMRIKKLKLQNDKNTLEQQKTSRVELSKKMETLSKKIAQLSEKDADKNNLEISKLTMELSQLANQLSFVSAGNSLRLADSAFNLRIDIPKLKFNMTNATVQGFAQPKLITFSNISFPDKSKKWTIYIPKGHKVNIDSKFGDITIDDDLDSLKIVNKSGNADLQNARHLVVNSEFGNVYAHNLLSADIDIRNGKLKTEDVKSLTINSKFSTIDMERVEKANINSSNDDYDITTVNELKAEKNFGNLRMSKLGKSFELTGNNADIKVRTMTDETKTININNKFAKISIPFTDIHDYQVIVKGNFNNTINNFGDQSTSFSDGDGYDTIKFKADSYTPYTSTTKAKQNEKLNQVRLSKEGTHSFITKSGNFEKGLKAEINCNSCTLDFK